MEVSKQQLNLAHSFSIRHLKHVESSESCGCYQCLAVFRPSEIKEWADEKTTALCPFCGVDAVIPGVVQKDADLADVDVLSQWFLQQMRKYWFEKPNPLAGNRM